jgi:hypothetical protein
MIVQHGLLSVAGLVLIGFSALLYFRLHSRLGRVGRASYHVTLPITLWLAIPGAYLKCAESEGWSRIPAYAAPACIITGITVLGFGLFRS